MGLIQAMSTSQLRVCAEYNHSLCLLTLRINSLGVTCLSTIPSILHSNLLLIFRRQSDAYRRSLNDFVPESTYSHKQTLPEIAMYKHKNFKTPLDI